MRVKRWRKVAWATVKLAVRLSWVVVENVVALIMFPLTWPFYLARSAHRREHKREE